MTREPIAKTPAHDPGLPGRTVWLCPNCTLPLVEHGNRLHCLRCRPPPGRPAIGSADWWRERIQTEPDWWRRVFAEPFYRGQKEATPCRSVTTP